MTDDYYCSDYACSMFHQPQAQGDYQECVQCGGVTHWKRLNLDDLLTDDLYEAANEAVEAKDWTSDAYSLYREAIERVAR